jgi:hypothetical protein
VKSRDKVAPQGDALSREIVEPQGWRLAHHKRKVSCHVVFVASRHPGSNVVHLEPNNRVGADVVFFNGWL